MKLLKNSDLIWEEKGIIIGIIYFLLKNIIKIKNVYIEDDLYRKIIKSIFPLLKIHNKFNDKVGKNGINICIKTISDIESKVFCHSSADSFTVSSIFLRSVRSLTIPIA